MRYQITLAPAFLHKIGVSFYEHGTLQRDGKNIFDYYRADKITPAQKECILSWCKDAKFFGSAKEYAPEMKSALVAFPKAAFYK